MNFRHEIATIMADCFVKFHDGTTIPESFINGGLDVALDALSLDSLSTIQICVELENRFNWSIAPNQLTEYGTLGNLASALETFAHER